jgi:hypothetical protein
MVRYLNEFDSNYRLVLAYASRSALELRAQGMGLPDLRKQLEDEEEVLFGYLRFRRRGIVLQYTHPDCSRVVKGIFHHNRRERADDSTSTSSSTNDFEFLSR